MNLQTAVRAELWDAVRGTYTAGNYTHAIVDGIHYLTDLIRQRADLDGDGVALVGEAFGGDDPKLKLNPLQTETEKNEQKGFAQILRGVYQGIRNPRSHEKNSDTKEAADAILHFLDYVAGVISLSAPVFTVESFLQSVFDQNFRKHERYVELLLSEIPLGKRLETFVQMFRTSVASRLKSRVQAFQVDACVVRRELPVNASA